MVDVPPIQHPAAARLRRVGPKSDSAADTAQEFRLGGKGSDPTEDRQSKSGKRGHVKRGDLISFLEKRRLLQISAKLMPIAIVGFTVVANYVCGTRCRTAVLWSRPSCATGSRRLGRGS